MIWGHWEDLTKTWGGKVSDHRLMLELLHSTTIIPVATEKNLAETVPVMGSTRVKHPLRFLQAIREISDQFPPCLLFAISFSNGCRCAVWIPARKR